ncbi:NAC domain-containing protein 2-like [Euphorbia lathyris]|uniref:NAC domain-containing protein 2-like n=1 Tax=Euphorbia lathyris TaxID=212925 RepID=UPI0033143962
MQSVLRNLPVGWRFQPTNQELLDHYLKNKRLGLPIHGSDIQEIQICDFDPWDLIDKNSSSNERYLFCRREFHLKTGGTQRKRKAKGGYWKRTGEIQSITGEDSDEVIGTKTIFVYHDPKPTEFVKHEFELQSPVQDDYDFVLCKLMINKKKKANKKLKKVGPLCDKKGTSDPKTIELDYNKNKPNKKAKTGLSDCDTALISDYNNQNQEELVANSAYDEGEPSDHITTDFRYQNRSFRAYSAYGEGKPINHPTLDSENQTPIMMTATSTFGKGGSSHQGACDFEYGNKYEMNNTSIYDKDTAIFLMDSDLGNQNPKEISDVSRYSISETSSQMTTNLENQIPSDMTAISLHEISSSWFENQNSGEITAVSTPKMVETSCLVNFDFENSNQKTISDSSCKEDEVKYPITLDFGNQNPSEETNSLLQETPPDFGKQNQYEKTDMSETENFCSYLLDSSVLETDPEEVESLCKKTDTTSSLDDQGEATFPEINSPSLDDLLEAFCSE